MTVFTYGNWWGQKSNCFISFPVFFNNFPSYENCKNKHLRRLLIILVGIISTIITLNQSSAQSCANYSPVTRSTGITYNSIVGSNPSYFVWRNTTSNQNDDNRSYPIAIGFDFWYLGVRYTQITASLNGTLDFSSSTSDGNNGGTGPYGPNYNNLFSTANQTMLALAPLYADLWTANGGTTPIATSLAYLLTGITPNRVLTVEWINFDAWNTPTNVPPASINMQVKIYEATGIIEFIYGTMTAGASGGGSYPLRYSCGINNTWASGAPNATQLLTQQSANSTTFNNTPQNALSTIPASNSKLTFTPPIPTAAPTGLTFSGISQSGMTLNWTDNATNEVGYAVYNSTDNVNFTFVSQVVAGSTSAVISGLTAGTIYYWRVYAVTDGALSSALSGSQSTLTAGIITSIATGNWNSNSTWDCGCIPTSGDNVIIANSTTVTLNTNATCNSLVIGQGVSGQLVIGNNGTARTLTVNNDVVVNFGGTLTTGAVAATHIMNVGGDITNNGTLNFAPTATRICNITFVKNGNQSVAGNGATTNFNRMTLNMGTSSSNELNITSSNFTVGVTNFLTLTNGTFKLSAAATITPFTGNVTIPYSGGIWINHPSANVTTTGGTVTLYGYLRATFGVTNIGNAANNNLTLYGGSIIIDGGNVNIAGRFDRAGPTSLTYFTMSDGTLTVATVGSTTAGAAPFRIDEVGSTFNMSGGTIIIRRPGAGNLGYVNTGGTNGTVTGGTLQIGDASTPAAQTIQINSSVVVPNLIISNGVPVTAQLSTNSLSVQNNITINSGTLNANSLNISLGGNWNNIGGTFTPGTDIVTFSSTSPQVIGGVSNTSFNNLAVDNSSRLIINTSPTINGTLTLTNGLITTGGNYVDISSTGTVLRTNGHIVGNLRKYIATGATSKNFEVGDTSNYTPVAVSFGNVTTGGILTASVTPSDHFDISNSGIDVSKSVNRYWTLTNSGIVFTNYSATFNFVPTDVDAGANTSAFIVSQYNGGVWTQPTVGTRTSTSTQTTGLTAFGDFQIGESIPPFFKTWDGGAGTSNWGDALNWNPNGVPTASHNITLSGNNNIDVNVAAVCNSILLNNSGLIVKVTNGNSLTVSGNLTINNGTLNSETAFPTVAGSTIITGGTVGYIGSGNQTIVPQNYNHLTLSGNGIKTASGNITIVGDFTNSVTMSMGTFTLSIGGNKTNNGVIQFAGATNGIVLPTGTIEYNGSVTQTVTAGVYNNLLLSNTGSKTISSATTTLGNMTISSGTSVTLSSGQSLQINNGFSNSGAFTNNGIVNVGP